MAIVSAKNGLMYIVSTFDTCIYASWQVEQKEYKIKVGIAGNFIYNMECTGHAVHIHCADSNQERGIYESFSLSCKNRHQIRRKSG